MLAIKNISVRNGQGLVLDDVSLEVHKGDQVRITGPNGAGKSTLLNAIMGLVPLEKGQIYFQGNDMSQYTSHQRAQMGLAYMRQRDNVFPALTVEENLRLALGSDGYTKFEKHYSEWAKDIKPSVVAGMLSGGQKQKLAWGMTVLIGNYLLLLDEPSAGVFSSAEMNPQKLPTAIFVEHN